MGLELTPGLAMVVVHDGEVAYLRGAGMADAESGRAVTPDTVFYIASSTKSFFGTAAAVVARRGQLDLERPISELTQGAQFHGEIDAGDITLLDLMNVEHTGMDGRSLMPMMTDQPAQRPGVAVSDFLDGKRAVRVGDWKMMVSTGDWVELYNIAEDPGETQDLDETALIARRACEVYLGESLASPDKGGLGFGQVDEKDLGSEEIAIDGELADQLEALGYFEH